MLSVVVNCNSALWFRFHAIRSILQFYNYVTKASGVINKVYIAEQVAGALKVLHFFFRNYLLRFTVMSVAPFTAYL
jgi:hypothetical protein